MANHQSVCYAGKVHLWKMFSVTLSFELMTLKMSSAACGPGME